MEYFAQCPEVWQGNDWLEAAWWLVFKKGVTDEEEAMRLLRQHKGEYENIELFRIYFQCMRDIPFSLLIRSEARKRRGINIESDDS